MDDYRNEVEQLALAQTGDSFYNSSIDHASVVIEKIFRHATDKVCIITKKLNGRVFGQDLVVKEARDFLSNANHKVRILMEDDASCLSEGHRLIEEFRQHPGSVEIKHIPLEISNKLEVHFTVADGKSYRFEPDKEKWEASVAFGDEDGGGALERYFESVWEKSEAVKLPSFPVSSPVN